MKKKMGYQKIVAESSSPPEKWCRYGDDCYLKTFKSCPADEDCYLKTFPTGYRFKPSDLELLSYYLMNKISGEPLRPNVIKKVDVYESTPAELTEKYKNYAVDGAEWYFFTDRERKYPKGDRPRRDTGSNSAGFWKATGNPDEINDNQNRKLGEKRTLVYYEWKPKMNSSTKENGKSTDKKKQTRESTKTDFKMHEYVMEDAVKPAQHPDSTNKYGSKVKLDLVLCKIYWNTGKAKRNSVPAAVSSTPTSNTLPSEDNVTPTSRAVDDNCNEAFVDPFPFFGIGLPSSLENVLFERELIEENQTDDFFYNLPEMDPNHPDFNDFVEQHHLTDQQRSLINCNRTNLPVAAQQQPKKRLPKKRLPKKPK